jgi:SAM-dependent methyltransferase
MAANGRFSIRGIFRKFGYELVPTKALLPREVRDDYDRVLESIGAYTFKFLDVRTFLTITLLRAHRLGLHKSPPLSVLDLGTGVGYFPFICAHYGHMAIALDRDGNRVFEDVTKWLKVDRRCWEIKAEKPLPVLGRRFDLVTGFMVNFDRFSEQQYKPWGVNEWDYFLRDVAEKQLRPGGRLVLLLNPHTTRQEHVLRYFRAKGALVANDWVEFRDLAPSVRDISQMEPTFADAV